MLSFYVRVFFTYMPLLGLKGLLCLFFIVRYGRVVVGRESTGAGWVWALGVTWDIGWGESQAGVAARE